MDATTGTKRPVQGCGDRQHGHTAWWTWRYAAPVLLAWIVMNACVQMADAADPAHPQNKPNVLFLISDDLNCRIGCYGDPVAKTPNIDQLAAMGVRFDRAYCQFPLCNPTRCSVMSGRYPTSTGVLDNNTLLVLADGQQTMDRYFEDRGYAVAQFGKIYHGPNRGFHKDEPRSSNPRIQRRLDAWSTPQQRTAQQAEEPGYWDRVHSPYRTMQPPDADRYAWANVFGPLEPGNRGIDAPVADKAIASMQKMAADSKPFFLAVGFYRPHVPLTAPKEFFDQHDPAAMPLPPDFDTQPRPVAGMPRDEFRQNIDLFCMRSFSVAEARQAIRAYYACVSYMDAQLGRVLDELEKLGLRNNTIIVFWGDHGWHLSEKGMWAKGTTFEVSSRGPLLIIDPRMETGGQASPRVVQHLDIYPTLVDLCGLPQPAWLEGTSLTPLLRDPAAPWDRPAYTVQTRNWFLGRSVRTERWRYTEWDGGRRGSMLFNHDRDPHEIHNLAADPAYADTVRQMRKLLAEGPRP